jgi:hypothetical protein
MNRSNFKINSLSLADDEEEEGRKKGNVAHTQYGGMGVFTAAPRERKKLVGETRLAKYFAQFRWLVKFGDAHAILK